DLRRVTSPGVEPGYRFAHRLHGGLAETAGPRSQLRQCLQGAVGTVPEARRERHPLPLGSTRRRQRRPVGRKGPGKLGKTRLGGYRRTAGLTEAISLLHHWLPIARYRAMGSFLLVGAMGASSVFAWFTFQSEPSECI